MVYRPAHAGDRPDLALLERGAVWAPHHLTRDSGLAEPPVFRTVSPVSHWTLTAAPNKAAAAAVACDVLWIAVDRGVHH
jgi:hypothetical protein